MPKVVDAARVTTKDNTVWRTCTGCTQLKSLPAGVDQCAACEVTAPAPTAAADPGWVLANQYAELVGRIEAWAFPVTDVSDAACLDRIRELLGGFAEQCRKGVA